MKTYIKIRYLLFAVLFIHFNSNAQELKINGKVSDSKDLMLLNKRNNENYNKLMACFDPSQIKSGFLLDKLLYSRQEVSQLNGSTKKIIGSIDFRSIYNKLLIAQTGVEKLKNYTEIQEKIEMYSNSGSIPIGIINMDCNTFNIKDLSAKVRNLDELIELYRKSELLEQKVILSTPLNTSSLTSNVEFIIPKELFISNSDTECEIEIDFGDGTGFRDVVIGDKIIVNYDEKGLKLIKTKITTDSKVYFSFSKISILSESSSKLKSATAASYTPPNRTINLTDLSRAYVEYGCNHTSLVKPFIFVEGLNFDAKPECPENQYRYGTFGWDVFRSGVDLDCSADPLKIDYLPSLISAIKADGFDIVFLDFKDGAGEIGHNADILIELITKVNAELVAKGSEYPLVVAGASMGGVVSRYALSKMEQTGQNHNTRLWLSLDAPLDGANIPIGDQLLIDFFSWFDRITDEKPEILIAKAQLNKMGPRQLMYYHFVAGSTDHTNLMSNPYYKFPTKPYTISIVNGSSTAVDQGFAPGTKMIDIDRTEKGRLFDHEQAESYACPNGSGKVFWGKVYIIPNVTEVEYTVHNFKPYDSAPGSTRNTNTEVGNGQEIYPNHCFVPTVSALGLNSGNLYLNVSTSVIMNNYPFIRKANNSFCPFNYVFLQNRNEDHIETSYENIMTIINTVMGTDIKLQNTQLTGLYEARNSIVAGQNLYTTSSSPDVGMALVKNGTSAKLRSAGTISLKTGFKVEYGGHFISYISPYSCAASTPVRLKSMLMNSVDDIENLEAANFNKDNQDISEDAGYKVYPNPSNGYFTISFINNLGPKHIKIYNLKGGIVYDKTILEDEADIDLTSYSQGVYFMDITTNTNKITKKLVIRK